jgi:predicted regulator of Ras-like GTPase activity (Roadblock/LC7/MglB family)
MTRKRVSSLSGDYLEAITGRLRELLVEADAMAVVMVDTMGQIIAETGSAGGFDLTTVVSLLAASFATTSEMSRRLSETRRTFNLTYHEGERYDIYASNIGSALFLVLIFDREMYAPKIGMVWLYIKRSIQDLLHIVAETRTTRPREAVASDFATSLRKELDSIFQERHPPSIQNGTPDEAQMMDLIRWRKKSQQEPKERKT